MVGYLLVLDAFEKMLLPAYRKSFEVRHELFVENFINNKGPKQPDTSINKTLIKLTDEMLETVQRYYEKVDDLMVFSENWLKEFE